MSLVVLMLCVFGSAILLMAAFFVATSVLDKKRAKKMRETVENEIEGGVYSPAASPRVKTAGKNTVEVTPPEVADFYDEEVPTGFIKRPSVADNCNHVAKVGSGNSKADSMLATSVDDGIRKFQPMSSLGNAPRPPLTQME